MKSLKQYITEARPKGQKRYQRDTSKLEIRLDKMYAAGGSQKKIDRAEMRLARRTNDGDYDIEEINVHTKRGQLDIPVDDENDPRAQSIDELMREIAHKIYTHGHSEAQVGAEIRYVAHDLPVPHKAVEGATDEDIGREAHSIYLQRKALIDHIKDRKKKK
jgi:hypothetical protein